MEGMREAGLAVGTDQVAQGYFTYRSGLAAAESLLKGDWRPTAIFASNDDMAAATMAVAHRLGLDVPGDLAITGFDNTPLATTVWPELTTVRQPIAEMAREAVMLLLEQIRRKRSGAPQQVMHKLLKFALIERESSSPKVKSTRTRKRPSQDSSPNHMTPAYDSGDHLHCSRRRRQIRARSSGCVEGKIVPNWPPLSP